MIDRALENKLQSTMLNAFYVTRAKNLKILQQMYGSLVILPPSCFVYFWKPI